MGPVGKLDPQRARLSGSLGRPPSKQTMTLLFDEVSVEGSTEDLCLTPLGQCRWGLRSDIWKR